MSLTLFLGKKDGTLKALIVIVRILNYVYVI